LICLDFNFFDLKTHFQLIIYLKYLQNILETMINLSLSSKKHSKNRNQSKSKNQFEFIYVFLWTLKVKKNTSNWEDFTQDFTQSGLNHQKKKEIEKNN